MSRYSILLLFLIFTFSYQALYSQKYATVKGRIIDKNSREELVGAIVLTQDINKGTYSNSSGVYQLTTRPKEIQLVFKFIGYQDVVLNFYLKRDTTINISMLQDNTLQAASVYASKLENTVKASGMGVIDISLRQVKSVPALMGEVDLMKYIQLMPGVQSGGDGNVGLYVRGGNYDQNMITLDGAIIYKPEHLLGFVSSFNPDVIDKTTLYKSSFPARYGSRLSSVVDIRTKEGDFQRYHASASIGFLSAKISAEGPIIKNKTSFLVSGRASYYNLITKSLLNNIYGKSESMREFPNIFFYDANAKLSHNFNDKSNLSLNFYIGHDYSDTEGKMNNNENIDIVNQRKTTNVQGYNTTNNWGNIVTSLNYENNIHDKLRVNALLSHSNFKYLNGIYSFSESKTYGTSSNTLIK